MKDKFASGPWIRRSARLSLYLPSRSSPVFPLQYGFNLVMSHPHAVNEIALSLNNKNPR